MGIRKHRGKITITIALIVMILTVVGLCTLAEEATLYIRDISVNPSVLDNIIISGAIEDKYHGQYFTIENSQVNQRIKFYDHHVINKKEDVKESLSGMVKVSENIHLSNLMARQLGGNNAFVYVSAYGSFPSFTEHNTGIINGIRDENTYLKIDNNNNYTILNEAIYFTVNTSPGFRGENGIYKVVDSYYASLTVKGKIEKISPIDLDETNNQLGVVGITSKNDLLLLITQVGNRLMVTAYNPETMDVVSEDALELELRYPNREVVIIEENDYIHLSFEYQQENFYELRNYDTGYFYPPSQERVIVTVEVKEAIQIINVSKIDTLDLKYNMIDMDRVFYIENKLFVFGNMFRLKENAFDFKYHLFVYEEENLLYHGELVTDIGEDFIGSKEDYRGDKLKSLNAYYSIERYFERYDFRNIQDMRIELRG
ncbi:hypothetical protein EDC18_10975 [Natranaerovirga pectinivora]|uniref:Uncharacterized protein n=1 Tax=Natranaerovirga pectinivora TaxID=682400 RepID=A0A4R3MHL4_9FIRM|nr:hypothetical protein [Natranaerovirga pectinivora]TCT13112.1 hypothetical protein EDC18_10975 [Natranaerovirga pectinivora]